MTIGIAIITGIIGIIVGWFLHLYFGKSKVVTKEVIKEVIKEVRFNQVQVAEVVIEGDTAYIVGWNYYGRFKVTSKKYKTEELVSYKNGDIFEYIGSSTEANLILETVSIA